MRRILPLLALLGACSKDATPEAAPVCDSASLVDGECPGVSASAVLCDAPTCTDGVACASTRVASSQQELDAATAAAVAGDCIALEGGSFGSVTLPPGVSLLGRGPGASGVQGIVIVGGRAATIRGVTVGQGGIAATDVATLTIDHVFVGPTASKTPGISLIDSGVALSATTVSGAAGYGVALDCDKACPASGGALSATFTGVSVQGATDVGIWARGYGVQIRGAEISATHGTMFGRGLEVDGGGSLDAAALAVHDNTDVGILVDGSSVQLDGVAVARNLRGVQLQATPAARPSKLANFQIVDNRGVGIGIDGGAQGIVIVGGRVAGTTLERLPTAAGGVAPIGDGLVWLGGSSAEVDSSVAFGGSARAGVVIDASSSGTFGGTVDGSNATGIVIVGGKSAVNVGAAATTAKTAAEFATPAELSSQ